MTPFFFGSSASPLFGVHHAPSKGARDTCVVVVPPMGQEALRAHRALKQLCIALARERFHALRFDLFGTGDSAGDFEEASLERWAGDVRSAADELRDRTGASRVSFVGLRLGAAHALAASVGRRDVDKLVLWEPVVYGGTLLAELERRHVDFLRAELPGRVVASPKDEALGFPITPALRAQLLALDLTRSPRSGAKSVAVIAAHETEDERRLAEALPNLAPRTSFTVVALEKDWNSEEAVNSSLVPAAAIDAVVRSLGER